MEERPFQQAGSREAEREAQMALCLSGGGYRAMLFHTGVLWRLNECGLLSRIDRFSSVSGGSISAGFLGLKWAELGLDKKGAVSENFERDYVAPIRKLAGQTIDVPAVLWSIPRLRRAGDVVAAAYRRHLFGSATLRDFPEAPRFVINATNMQSGALWRFSRPYMRDYRVGMIANPDVSLAVAVAASSAFPPFLSPVVLRLRDGHFEAGSGTDLQRPPFTTRVILGDGGIYDNLGLEAAKQCRTILVSDAGGRMAPAPRVSRLWALQGLRVLSLVDNQVRSLRKRHLMDALQRGSHGGAYWGIQTDILDYNLPDALPCPHGQTMRLAEAPTRLGRFAPALQEQLINWGYAVCDAGIRSYVCPELPRPSGFPYPNSVIG